MKSPIFSVKNDIFLIISRDVARFIFPVDNFLTSRTIRENYLPTIKITTKRNVQSLCELGEFLRIILFVCEFNGFHAFDKILKNRFFQISHTP